MVDTQKLTVEEAHIEFAKSSNARVWALLSKETRSETESQEMLSAAYASLYHWSHIGTAVNLQRAHWLLSRVFVVLHQTESALSHALLCMGLTEGDHDALDDFDIAYAHEALARAYALDNKLELAKDHFSQAQNLADLIEDEEDQRIFLDDLMSGDLSDLV